MPLSQSRHDAPLRPLGPLLAGLALAALTLVGCRSAPTTGAAPAHEPSADPSATSVPLATSTPDWRGQLVVDNGDVGIWTVAAVPFFPQYAGLQLVGLDDQGVVHVLVQYSGKWTHYRRGGDGGWLGGLAHGDADPRVEGAELYVGGELGNVYQLRPYADGNLDMRRVAAFPGHEVHTLVCADLDPTSPGEELLVLTRPGHLWRLHPDGAHGAFRGEDLGPLPSRVRDAVALPREDDAPVTLLTASRDGGLRSLALVDGRPHWELLHRADTGMGRLALHAGDPRVVYATLDDGRLERLQRDTDGAWAVETIYAGPSGPRGVASGRFHEDPDIECVALFGYGARVQLLTRGTSGWEVQDLFTDRDRGHWLAAAELDGRNGTLELVGSGYGGRVFLLARHPGFGRPGVATDPGPGR